MATFSVNVPDDKVQLIGEAFCQQSNFQPVSSTGEGLDVVNTPLVGQELLDAQIEFARQACIRYINATVRAHLNWKATQEQPPIPDKPVDLT